LLPGNVPAIPMKDAVMKVAPEIKGKKTLMRGTITGRILMRNKMT
jgi:hypothetical protein